MRTALFFLGWISSIALAQVPEPILSSDISITHKATLIPPSRQETGLAPGTLFTVGIFGLYLRADGFLRDETVKLRLRPAGSSTVTDLQVVSVDNVASGLQAQVVTSIIPANAPAGIADLLAVGSNGKTFYTRFWIVPSGFGLLTKSSSGFDAALAQVLRSAWQTVSLTKPVRSGEWVTLWGTGLGTAAPDSIRVNLGGVIVTPKFAGPAPDLTGIDQVTFLTPDGIPGDCYVPVSVTVDGVARNTPPIATSTDGGPCKHRLGLSADELAALDRGEALPFSTSEVRSYAWPDYSTPGRYFQNDAFHLDFAMRDGLFLQLTTGLWTNPVASCTVRFDGGISFGFAIPPLESGTPTVSGPGNVRYAMDGVHGNFNYSGTPTDNYKLDAIPASTVVSGDWSVQVEGGRDVNPFRTPLRVPPPLRWTNRATMAAVAAQTDVVFKWEPAGYSDKEWVVGDIASGYGSVVCQGPATAGTLTIPADLIAKLQLTTGAINTAGLQLYPTDQMLYRVPSTLGGTFGGRASFNYAQRVIVELR